MGFQAEIQNKKKDEASVIARIFLKSGKISADWGDEDEENELKIDNKENYWGRLQKLENMGNNLMSNIVVN